MNASHSVSSAVALWFALLVTAGACPAWNSDLDQAITQAKQEEKDLLVVFRGPNAVDRFKEINEKVLDGTELREKLAARYVFFSVSGDTIAEKEREEARILARQRFKATTSPVIYLADAEARVYAMLPLQSADTGFYLEQITKLQSHRQVLGELLELQDAALEPAEKFRKIGDHLETLGAEIALRHYPDLVTQVIEADPTGSHGFAAVWQQRRKSAAILAEFSTIYTQIAPTLWNLSSPDEMVALLDATIGAHGLEGELRQLMEMQKYRVWGKVADYPKMIEIAERARVLAPESNLGKKIPEMIEKVKALQAKRVAGEAGSAPSPGGSGPEAEGRNAEKPMSPLAGFKRAWNPIQSSVAEAQSAIDKVALIDSRCEALALKGEVKQLMEMEKFRIWQADGNTAKMAEVGEQAISLAPETRLALRLRAILSAVKKSE